MAAIGTGKGSFILGTFNITPEQNLDVVLLSQTELISQRIKSHQSQPWTKQEIKHIARSVNGIILRCRDLKKKGQDSIIQGFVTSKILSSDSKAMPAVVQSLVLTGVREALNEQNQVYPDILSGEVQQILNSDDNTLKEVKRTSTLAFMKMFGGEASYPESSSLESVIVNPENTSVNDFQPQAILTRQMTNVQEIVNPKKDTSIDFLKSGANLICPIIQLHIGSQIKWTNPEMRSISKIVKQIMVYCEDLQKQKRTSAIQEFLSSQDFLKMPILAQCLVLKAVILGCEGESQEDTSPSDEVQKIMRSDANTLMTMKAELIARSSLIFTTDFNPETSVKKFEDADLELQIKLIYECIVSDQNSKLSEGEIEKILESANKIFDRCKELQNSGKNSTVQNLFDSKSLESMPVLAQLIIFKVIQVAFQKEEGEISLLKAKLSDEIKQIINHDGNEIETRRKIGGEHCTPIVTSTPNSQVAKDKVLQTETRLICECIDRHEQAQNWSEEEIKKIVESTDKIFDRCKKLKEKRYSTIKGFLDLNELLTEPKSMTVLARCIVLKAIREAVREGDRGLSQQDVKLSDEVKQIIKGNHKSHEEMIFEFVEYFKNKIVPKDEKTSESLKSRSFNLFSSLDSEKIRSRSNSHSKVKDTLPNSQEIGSGSGRFLSDSLLKKIGTWGSNFPLSPKIKQRMPVANVFDVSTKKE